MLNFIRKIWSLGAGQILLKASNLWVFWYLADIGGAATLGLIVLGAALLKYTTLVSDLGWNITSLIESTRDNSKSKSAELYSYKLVWSIPVIGIVSALIFAFTDAGMMRQIAFWYVMSSFFDVLFPDWYFQAKQKFHYINQVRISAQIVFVALIFTQVHSGEDFHLVSFFYFISHVGMLPLMIWAASRIGFGGYHPKYLFQSFSHGFNTRFKKWFHQSFHIGMSQVFLSVSLHYGALILGLVAENNLTGNFGFALKILGAAMIVDQIIHLFLLSGLQSKFKERYSYLQLATFFSYITWLGTLLVVALPIDFIYHFIAPEFKNLASDFRVLSLFLPLTIFHSFVQTWIFHQFTGYKIFKVSLYSAIAPFVIMTTTALQDPESMPQAMILSEFLLVTFLSYFAFDKQFKAICVWLFTLGPISLYLVNQFNQYSWSSKIVLPIIIISLISIFHPLRPTLPQTKPLLKRWKKLNKSS